MRNSLIDRLIDGPLGPPLIWLLMIAFAVLAVLAWPLLKLWQMGRWLREWKQAIADVDAGGDSNDKT
jgi:type VI protein secretion system component VasK